MLPRGAFAPRGAISVISVFSVSRVKERLTRFRGMDAPAPPRRVRGVQGLRNNGTADYHGMHGKHGKNNVHECAPLRTTESVALNHIDSPQRRAAFAAHGAISVISVFGVF